jgi:steroid delta-isomerase-like uncharacterized protein
VTEAENKEFFRRLIEVVFNEGRHDLLRDFVSETSVDHNPVPDAEGQPVLDGLTTFLEMRRRAFPDLVYTIDEVMAEDDKVFGLLTLRGTHTGASGGFPPSGAQVEMKEMTLVRIQDGKIVERWGIVDMASLLRQFGLA